MYEQRERTSDGRRAGGASAQECRTLRRSGDVGCLLAIVLFVADSDDGKVIADFGCETPGKPVRNPAHILRLGGNSVLDRRA